MMRDTHNYCKSGGQQHSSSRCSGMCQQHDVRMCSEEVKHAPGLITLLANAFAAIRYYKARSHLRKMHTGPC
jgi:hypothetical protein